MHECIALQWKLFLTNRSKELLKRSHILIFTLSSVSFLLRCAHFHLLMVICSQQFGRSKLVFFFNRLNLSFFEIDQKIPISPWSYSVKNYFCIPKFKEIEFVERIEQIWRMKMWNEDNQNGIKMSCLINCIINQKPFGPPYECSSNLVQVLLGYYLLDFNSLAYYYNNKNEYVGSTCPNESTIASFILNWSDHIDEWIEHMLTQPMQWSSIKSNAFGSA